METYDVILFMGQSNMQGQTDRFTDDNAPIEGALEYRYFNDALIELKTPVGENVKYDMTEGFYAGDDIPRWQKAHVLGAACEGGTNLVPKFCDEYVMGTGRKVVAVHVAKGATTVAEWLPGSTGYGALTAKVDKAFIKIKSEKMILGSVYAVWLQGESDALAATTKAQYKERLTTLKNALKERYGVKYFGIIKVGEFALNDCDQTIFDAQEEMCVQDKDFVMLTRVTHEIMRTPEYMNPEARGHYSVKGITLIGEKAGKALAEIVKLGRRS